jgi:aconitate hydratase
MPTKDLCATYQILKNNLVSGSLKPGEEIGVRADQMMFQDGTGTMVFLHLAAIGRPRLKGKLAICYVDHNTLQSGPENGDDHRFLQTSCEKYKLHFSKPGNGIGHQLHLERFAAPGMLLLGADSHVPTLGGLGMLAIGTGGLELAVALTGAPHYLICPSITRVVLVGRLKPWCSAKDVILTIIKELSSRNNVGTSLEYAGDGVKTLSITQRATIANMGAELGVTTSLFPSDEVSKKFLQSQGRTRDYSRLTISDTAEVDQQIEINLSKVVPMVALPGNPENVVTVKEAGKIPVQQVAIGSCTNGAFEDMAKAALILKDKVVHPEVSLVVAPATRQVTHTLLDRGYLKHILSAGARLTESVCGFCIGHGQAPGSDWVSVRTNNRNYEGRCGTPDAKVYLVSPETAAATALKGYLCDPRDLKRPAPRFKMPIKFETNDRMIIAPTKKTRRNKVERGPNIVDPPKYAPLAPTVRGEAILKLGDHISTDHILPAGRWLKFRSNIQEYAWHTFKNIDPKFYQRATANKERKLNNIIVAGFGYGEGSSREHAAMCPRFLDVRVVIAKGFERIHVSNLINHGIVPLTFMDGRGYEKIEAGDDLELPWVANEIKRSELVTVRSPEKGYVIRVKHGLNRRQIDILLAGGLRNYVSG